MDKPPISELRDSDGLIPINVWLAGRSYRILIPAAEEMAVRRSVKDADQKIAELRQHYGGKDDQDFVAMCLLMYATAEAGNTVNAINEEILESMIRKIDKALGPD